MGEQGFVVGGFDKVLVGAGSGAAAFAFLRHRARRRSRSSRQGALAAGHRAVHQYFIPHPGVGCAHRGIHRLLVHFYGLLAFHVEQVQVDAAVFRLQECDLAAVGAPGHVRDARRLRKAVDAGFCAGWQVLQPEAGAAGAAAGAVVAGIKPKARDAEFRFGKLGN